MRILIVALLLALTLSGCGVTFYMAPHPSVYPSSNSGSTWDVIHGGASEWLAPGVLLWKQQDPMMRIGETYRVWVTHSILVVCVVERTPDGLVMHTAGEDMSICYPN
jgi:uncharacterized protein YceK